MRKRLLSFATCGSFCQSLASMLERSALPRVFPGGSAYQRKPLWTTEPWAMSARDTAIRLLKELWSQHRWPFIQNLLLDLSVALSSGVGLFLLLPLLGAAGIGQKSRSLSLGGALALFVVVLVLRSAVQRLQTIKRALFVRMFLQSKAFSLYNSLLSTSWSHLAKLQRADYHHGITVEMSRTQVALVSTLHLLSAGVLTMGYTAVAFYLSPQVTMLTMAMGATVALILRKQTKLAQQVGANLSEKSRQSHAVLDEHLRALKQARAYGVVPEMQVRFQQVFGELLSYQDQAARLRANNQFWLQTLSAVILAVATFAMIDGTETSPAKALVLVATFSRLIPMLGTLEGIAQQGMVSLPGYRSVCKLIEELSDHAEPEPLDLVLDFRKRVAFRDVTYMHTPGESGVRALSFEIERGKWLSLEGPSGAGKSTTVDLLLGLLHPQRGEILIDESVLSRENILSWRARIGFVAQDPYLFHGTIRENLLWAAPSASIQDLEWALAAASAEFALSSPDGLETPIGDGGIRLSGGERRRLALARAFLRRPEVLILDEPTAGLDAVNKGQILDTLQRMVGEYTVITISHDREVSLRAHETIWLEPVRLVAGTGQDA